MSSPRRRGAKRGRERLDDSDRVRKAFAPSSSLTAKERYLYACFSNLAGRLGYEGDVDAEDLLRDAIRRVPFVISSGPNVYALEDDERADDDELREILFRRVYGQPTVPKLCSILQDYYGDVAKELELDLTEALPPEVLGNILERSGSSLPAAAATSKRFKNLSTRRLTESKDSVDEALTLLASTLVRLSRAGKVVLRDKNTEDGETGEDYGYTKEPDTLELKYNHYNKSWRYLTIPEYREIRHASFEEATAFVREWMRHHYSALATMEPDSESAAIAELDELIASLQPEQLVGLFVADVNDADADRVAALKRYLLRTRVWKLITPRDWIRSFLLW